MSFITDIAVKFFGGPMARKYAGSIIRHGITAASGALIAAGLPELAEILEGISPQLTEIATGLAVFLVGVALSFKDKAEKKSEDE